MPPKEKQKYDIVLIEGSNDPPRANLYPPPDLDSIPKQIKYTAILMELNNNHQDQNHQPNHRRYQHCKITVRSGVCHRSQPKTH